MAKRGVERGIAAVAAVFLAGCDLTFPWSAGDLPDGPRDLAAAEDPLDFDVVRLSWTAAPGQAAVEAQARAGGGEWRTLGALLAGAGDLAVRLDPAVPERTPLAFRIRVEAGGAVSRWSNEAPFLRGIRPPSAFAAEMGMEYTTRSGPVTVTWTSAPSVATALQLERSALDAAGSPTTWATLADASLASGRYVDHLLQDGVAYAYRVRVGADGLWSAPREAWTPPVDLAAPWGLRVVGEDGGARLTWTNQSTTAESVTVTRYTRGWPDWDFHLDLPPGQETWLDAGSIWPVTSYEITASRQSAYLYAKSEVVSVEPFTLPGPPALAASALRLPEGEWVARGAAGRFHLAQEFYESPRVHRATAAGHETHVLPEAVRLATPGVIVDAQDAPHTVFLRAATGSARTEVVHAWWDGAAWRSEVVATDDVAGWVSNTGQAWFGLDAAGDVQVLYRRTEPFPAQESLVHVARAGAAWVVTSVATPSLPDFWRWSAAFAVAPDGSAYVAQLGESPSRNANLIVLCTRSPAGGWSDEVVPAGAFNFEGPWLAAGDGGEVAVFHTNGYSTTDVVALRKAGGSWSAPEIAVTRTPAASSLQLAIAPRPAAGRLALATWSLGRAEVHVRGEEGWSSATVGPSSVLRAWLGFGPAGEAWALFPHDSASSGEPVPYSLFEEVR